MLDLLCERFLEFEQIIERTLDVPRCNRYPAGCRLIDKAGFQQVTAALQAAVEQRINTIATMRPGAHIDYR